MGSSVREGRKEETLLFYAGPLVYTKEQKLVV